MMLRALVVGGALALAGSAFASTRALGEDSELASGIQQAQEGDFDAAVVTLDGVVRRLAGQPARAKDLARAYTYLAIAYFGLSQEQLAKARFLEAWRADPEMKLSPDEFPPRIWRFLEEASADARKAAPAPVAPPTTGPEPAERTSAPATAAASPAPRKGGSKTLPILLGLGGAAAVGVAVAAGGGGGGSSSSAPTVTAAPVPSGGVSSPVSGQSINCRTAVLATVTLTNPTASAISVTGVRLTTAVPSGGCPSNTFVYQPAVTSVSPGQTVTVFNQSLFSAGAGCCPGTCPGTTCTFQQGFAVLTSVGEISAGAFSYVVQFVGCEQCSSALGAAFCPPASGLR